MKHKKIIFLFLVLFIGLVVFSIIKRKKELEKAHKLELPPAHVEVFKVKPGVVVKKRTYIARIESENITKIIPHISAYVDKILVSEGDSVKKGQLLIKLDDRELKSAYDAQKSNLNSLKQKLNATKLNFEYITREYKRLKRLYSKQAISFDKFDKVKTNYEATKANIKSLEFQVESAKAMLEKANIMLSYTEIRSPFNGKINIVFADEGELAAPGKPLLEIWQNGRKKLVFRVNQRYIENISENTKVYFDYNNKHYETKIDKIYPAADNMLFFTVESYLPENSNFILGARIPVYIDFIHKNTSKVVPKTVLLDNNHVFLIKDEKLKLTKIKTGAIGDNFVEVVSGLKSGDLVANAPFLSLNLFYDGQRVEVRK